jgi:hypothetical protein
MASLASCQSCFTTGADQPLSLNEKSSSAEHCSTSKHQSAKRNEVSIRAFDGARHFCQGNASRLEWTTFPRENVKGIGIPATSKSAPFRSRHVLAADGQLEIHPAGGEQGRQIRCFSPGAG